MIPAPPRVRAQATDTPAFDPFGLGDAAETEAEAEPVIAPPTGRTKGAGATGRKSGKKKRPAVEAWTMLALFGIAMLAVLVGMASASLKVPALSFAVLVGMALSLFGSYRYFRAIGMPGLVTILLLCFFPILGLIAWTWRWKEAPRPALAIWLGLLIATFGGLEIIMDHRPGLRPDFRTAAPPAPQPNAPQLDPSLSAPRVADRAALAEFRSKAPTGDPTARLVYNLESPDKAERMMAWLGLREVPVAEEHRAAVVKSTHKHLNDPDQLTRHRSVEMLAKWSPPDADLVPTLIPFLSDNINIYTVVLGELQRRKDPRALGAIAAQMDFEDRVGTASTALAEYGPAAEDTLIRVLDGGGSLARYWACVKLGDGEVGTARCLPALEKAARGNDARVARAAEGAILTIKNRTQ